MSTEKRDISLLDCVRYPKVATKNNPEFLLRTASIFVADICSGSNIHVYVDPTTHKTYDPAYIKAIQTDRRRKEH
jgi:hypothetical protein